MSRLTRLTLALAFAVVPSLSFAQYGPVVKIADLADTRVAESSGLATSRLYPDPSTGILWTHNDSGRAPYLFATNRAGGAVSCFEIVCPNAPGGQENIDWEDMAEGPGPGGTNALYIADIGDNTRTRTNCAIYRVTEPDAYAGDLDPAVSPQLVAQRFPFVYPNGVKYDAEAILVHPTTAQVFIITKDLGGVSIVWKFPQLLTSLAANQVTTLQKAATVRFNHSQVFGRTVTSADISPDGRKLVVRTYSDAYEWPIGAGQSIGYVFQMNSRTRYTLPLDQGEAIAYRPDGLALLTTSEASPCPLYELPPP